MQRGVTVLDIGTLGDLVKIYGLEAWEATRNRIYMELPKKYRPMAKKCGMTQKEFIETAFNHFITTAVPYYEKLHKDYKHLHKPIKIKPIKLPTESTRGKEERLAYQREYYRKNRERILKDRTKKSL